MIRFLLDTNIISEPLRPKPNTVVIQKLQQYEEAVSIASISWHELWFGCYRLPNSQRRRRIEKYLRETVQLNIPILAYDNLASEWFASERARLVSIGKTPAYADGQIASIAKVNNLILVTNNVSDYSDFQELQLENWFFN